MAGDEGRMSFFAQAFCVEFEADQKHEGQQPDLAQGIEEAERGLWEEGRGKIWGEPAEQGRSQHNTGNHLANHLRLVYLTKQPAYSTRCHENDRYLRDEDKKLRHNDLLAYLLTISRWAVVWR